MLIRLAPKTLTQFVDGDRTRCKPGALTDWALHSFAVSRVILTIWSRHLPDWRLSVVATLDQRALMLKMAPLQIAVVIAALVACFLIGWLARVLSRRVRQFGRLEEINAVMRETVPVEIMVFDPERRLVVVNRATRAVAGSDEWALAAIVYEALTGQRPFYDSPGPADSVAGDRYLDRLLNVATPDEPEKLNPSVSPQLSAVLVRALSQDVSARF